MKLLFGNATGGRLRSSVTPEERLLLAVVESAYWDLRSGDPARWQTARNYFVTEQDEHTFSFASICQHFSWSPGSIRSQLAVLLQTRPASACMAAC